MAFFPELEHQSLPQLETRFVSHYPPNNDPAESDLWFQEIAVRIARTGSEGLSFLLNRIADADVTRQRAIALSLCFLDKDVRQPHIQRLRTFLLAALSHENPLLIADAI